MSYYINAITRHYADFQGRARRKEFWMYTLFNVVFATVAVILDIVLGTGFASVGVDVGYGYGLIYLLFVIGIFVPTLAMYVRRLHDVGKSGWFLLVILIPLAGAIWFLVPMCTDSQPGTNQYGPNPKGFGAAAANAATPAGFCAGCGSPRTMGATFCPACGKPA